MKVTKLEVIDRAIDILKRGSLVGEWAEHGKACPYCALAMAKSQLDNERGTGLDAAEALRQHAMGEVIEDESDAPLIDAVDALKQIIASPDKLSDAIFSNRAETIGWLKKARKKAVIK